VNDKFPIDRIQRKFTRYCLIVQNSFIFVQNPLKNEQKPIKDAQNTLKIVQTPEKNEQKQISRSKNCFFLK
jgi:hypothetical protein